MSFPKTIIRGHGVGAPTPTVNTDTSPLALTGASAAAYAQKDNCFAPALVGESGQIARQLIVAAAAPAGVVSVALEVDIYDPDNELWYAAGSIQAGKIGSVLSFAIPIPGGKDRTSAPSPIFAFVPTFSSTPDGAYLLAVGVDFGVGVGVSAGGSSSSPAGVHAHPSASLAYAQSHVLSANPCTLYGSPTLVTAVAPLPAGAAELAGGNFFAQLFDAASLPANGAVPVVSIPFLHVGGVVDTIDFGREIGNGRVMQTGAVMAISSTQGTLTVAAGNYSVRIGGEIG